MPQNKSKSQFYQEASLSQKLAHKDSGYVDYAGVDQNISVSLAMLNVLHAFKIIDLESPEWKFVKAVLNERRKALFATSDKVNEITKMGLQMPKAEDIISSFDEEE